MRAALFLFILSGFLFHTDKIIGQTFSVADIPDSLKISAHTVIRLSEKVFEVRGKTSATLTVREATTILDDSGKDDDALVVYYDKAIAVKSYRGSIFDASGKLIKTIKSSDFKDESAVLGSSLYDDSRKIYYQPMVASLPYTVMYEVECQLNGFINFPGWMPVNEYSVSVQNSSYQIIVPAGYSFRYKGFNIPEPEVVSTDKTVSYRWEIAGMKAVEDEIFSPSPEEFLPVVTAAPDEFVFEDYPGRMDTWRNFGLWSSQLLEGRNVLSDETVAKMQAMVAGIDDPVEKTRAIYDFLQTTTRYVSITLGIGGFQPFAANEVEKTGYGDCKALTNYTRSLLAAVGINSYYTLVNAGNNAHDLWLDFPCQQFNHAIVCVPLEHDTIWLECTDNRQPFGFLGMGTDNRYALLVTDSGGVITRTRSYTFSENTQCRNMTIDLDETGNGTATVNTRFSGLQYDNVSDLLYQRPEDQKNHYYRSIPYSNFQINHFEIQQEDKPVPTILEQLSLYIPTYATLSGKRMFLLLNPLNQYNLSQKAGKERKNDIVIRRGFWDADTVEFTFPQDYRIEHKPENISISTPFGEYSTTISSENNHIRYIRHLKLFSGRYPASHYSEMETFLRQLQRSDQQKAVLIREN